MSRKVNQLGTIKPVELLRLHSHITSTRWFLSISARPNSIAFHITLWPWCLIFASGQGVMESSATGKFVTWPMSCLLNQGSSGTRRTNWRKGLLHEGMPLLPLLHRASASSLLFSRSLPLASTLPSLLRRRAVFLAMSTAANPQPPTHSLVLPTQPDEPVQIFAAPGVTDSQFRHVLLPFPPNLRDKLAPFIRNWWFLLSVGEVITNKSCWLMEACYVGTFDSWTNDSLSYIGWAPKNRSIRELLMVFSISPGTWGR